ncbi:ATP-binding cassette domain-containing protein [Methylocystis sp. L43]|jgi:ATP-binding cassette subfamily F protein uup|uniref:ABC-F family ATP-binding cassette domain-containing protein n=1 Tax=unclassified Methylocystis TaxID=2625913 RepID=UPI0018C23562|nr:MULTISPECIES: ATP-binding cassette domain-containing protein [unclassified Methylocystis]MBG0798017.1 ATP-binding cassette domain-containing protein [Methylocystis sp. L43]MBG0805605.1 ATP-binding cassette domain-containing protein [Methylocystis sp. H15]
MAPPPLLALQGVMLTLGGKPLLEGADFAVAPGARLCVVGRNGSGKSTLLKIAAGEIEPDAGVRFLQPGASLRYLPQEPDFSGFATALAYVEAGLGPLDDPHVARTLLNDLGLEGDENPARLSGGEARRAALARVLAPEPDILLLDEPTNHLDLPTILWLEERLATLRSALVLISHDRRFLQDLTGETLWIDRGRTRHLARGFKEFEAWRDRELEEEEKQQHKLERKIVAEEHWLRHGVSGRRKRNMKRLGGLHHLRAERRDRVMPTGDVKLEASEAQLSGKLVIEAIKIGKSYGERVIVENFTTRILRGDRIGIIGANGAGKTTLVNLLTGALAPDSGKVRLGANLEMATLEQSRASLDPGTTLQDALTGGGSDTIEINGERRHVIGYMKDFLFKPEQARTPIGRLSGGERGRLLLARALAKPSNLLALDEPTNDLDLETLDLLEEMLADYPGTLIVVSHDRDFLDRVATSVLMSDGDGRWIEYAGGYSDMVAQRGKGVETRGAFASARETKEKPAPREKAAIRQKLSFKEQHALATLPGKIDALREQCAKLQRLLDDPELYARDPAKFAKASEAFAVLQADIAKAEDEWLALEIKREEERSN